MKHYNRLRLLTVILILSVTVSVVLSSCSDGSDTPNDNAGVNQNAESGAESIAETEPVITYDVPDMDCDGYEFTVMVRESYLGVYWVTNDVFADVQTGEPINDAVYIRNRLLEEKFNININEVIKGDMPGAVQMSIQAGDDDYDVCYPIMQNAGSMIQRGHLINLYDVPHMNFDKPWWDKTINDTLTIGNKLYAAAGSITMMTNDATWAVLFNKDLTEGFALEDHYQIVKDGKWTLDVLYTNSKAATRDLNGDGEITETDQWGAVHQHECAFTYYAASGQKAVVKNSDDLPVLDFNNDRTISVLDKVIAFMSDGEAQIKADDYSGKYANPWDEITTKVFNESRALYLITNFDMVKTLRNMEASFGIIPLPKYDAAQTEYYNTMQYNNATLICIPLSASNLERSGAILEAWAAESVSTVTKAYYDITLKGKVMRDDESSEMLDVIFTTRVIDQGIFFNWSNMSGFFTGFSNRKTMDFSSQYDKNESKWLAEMEKTVTAITESNV